MAFPSYTTADTSDGTLDVELLHAQIVEDPAIATALLGVDRAGSSFMLLFAATPSAAEQVRCDALVSAHSSLPIVQERLVAEIKAHRDGTRLDSQILAEYPPGSGLLFSCKAESQANWSALVSLDSLGLAPYPMTVTTYDERATYTITTSADLSGIVGAISGEVLAERALAQPYIDGVIAATSVADAQAAAAPYLAF